ncbi:hypothetical protein ACTOB_005614 [Actinoplanes oblitus]|uniref:2'-5' RNA ligase n=1 Tax=Actinoplanes oblitus TaxID=3040509 RepID=A0ABY8WB53_9ACTN|nr:hypothetical protein [Actinoplanes oblitus]WIM93629.1 hypothetical protein ACTOB_005614 [Actinoplanes oblitus]
MPYGIVLLPDPETADRLAEYAAHVGASGEPLMTIGPAAPPHLTLLHADCGAEAAQRWWTCVAGALPPVIWVRLNRLAFSPISPGDFHVPEGGVYAGLEAFRGRELDAAHDTVVRCAGAVDGRPLTGIGDAFSPHITLGVLRRFPAHRVELPADLVTGRFPLRPALGALGRYGTFPDILGPE